MLLSHVVWEKSLSSFYHEREVLKTLKAKFSVTQKREHPKNKRCGERPPKDDTRGVRSAWHTSHITTHDSLPPRVLCIRECMRAPRH